MPRSGSNLLTDGLHATRRAGRPKQFFSPIFLSHFARKHQLDPANDYPGYVSALIEQTSTSNRVFGFKLMGWYVKHFLNRLRETHAREAESNLQLLRTVFPRLRFIRITRQDRLRQAISKARAYQTGQWKVQDNEPATSDNAAFDPALIERCFEEIAIEEGVWRQFFEQSGASALEIEYQQLCRDYTGTIACALDFLEIRVPRSAMPQRPTTLKQSDAISAEWEARYREMKEPLVAA